MHKQGSEKLFSKPQRAQPVAPGHLSDEEEMLAVHYFDCPSLASFASLCSYHEVECLQIKDANHFLLADTFSFAWLYMHISKLFL